MPTTFQALAVILVALLPGALFIWAAERLAGRWGIALSDRLLRFVGVSTVLHLLAAPATYIIWHNYLRTGARAADSILPLWLWPVAGLYAWVPIVLGTLMGLALRDQGLPDIFTGANPAPTAWDHVFFSDPDAWVRMRLKSGVWIGGAYSAGSYTGGYPEPADIFLSIAAEVDPDTGEFNRSPAGNPILKEYGHLVRWTEIEYLDFAPR
jgi:Family of unknown function (DUF6338)